MDRKTKYLAAVFLVLACYFPTASAEGFRGNTFSLILGIKDQDLRDWPPYGEQSEVGIELVVRKEKYPFALVLDYLSGNSEFDYFGKEQSSTDEFNAGLRLEAGAWDNIYPYLESGISYVKGKVHLEGSNVDPNRNFKESAFGPWVSVGISWIDSSDISWGIKLRKTTARTDLPSGRSVDLGGLHYMFTMGFDYY